MNNFQDVTYLVVEMIGNTSATTLLQRASQPTLIDDPDDFFNIIPVEILFRTDRSIEVSK